MKLVKITGNATDGWRREPAPSIINTDGQPNYSPTVAQLNALGYYDEPSHKPDPIDGKIAVLTGYEVVDGKWRAVYSYEDVPPDAVVISKYALEEALFDMGKLAEIDALIDSVSITNEFGQSMPLRRKYDTATAFSTSDPYFARYLEVVKAALGMTDAQVDELMERCKGV